MRNFKFKKTQAKMMVYVFLFLTMFCGPLWAHKGHGAVTHPIHIAWGLGGAQEMQNQHPIFVHFPIAFLLGAAGFYLLGLLLKKENFFIVGKWTLFAGALSSAVAVWTGLRGAETVAHDEEIHQIMMRHQYLGFAILVISILWSLWLLFSKGNIPSRGRKVFVGGLLVMAVIIPQQADFGGRMVFLKGVGVGKRNPEQNENLSNPAIEKWQAIESHQSHLKMTIEGGDLEKVHEIAFAIRDLVKTLPGENLTADQKIVFQSLLKEVEEEAELLDQYGDAGNKPKAQDEFQKFTQTLLSVKSLYGKS